MTSGACPQEDEVRKPALGRGLDAILGSTRTLAGSVDPDEHAAKSGEPLVVPIERIAPGRGQPRRHFDETTLEELAGSIRANGILQPLLVTETNGRFELIAGERRLRAATRAGLDRVPVIIKRDISADRMVEMALIENVQREDLTPIEQARGYQRLIDDHGYTQEQLALRIGKSRTAVTNSLRLLKLPKEICELLDQGALGEGHARALLALRTAAQQVRLAARIVKEQLSVRQVEDLVRRSQDVAPRTVSPATASPVESALRAAEQSIGRRLATRVRIRGTPTRGRIEVEYYSRDELDRLIERLGT